MNGCNDPGYLRDRQYRDASNLEARIDLHRRFSTSSYPWLSWMFDQFDLPATARVLEVGCGPGSLWRANSERLPADWEITLSDFSPGMLDDARRNLADLGRPFIFQEADVQQLPFDDAQFDGVIANHMLYHVPDIDRALREIRRVLRPGGTLYAATNGVNHLAEMDLLVQRFDPALTGGFAIRGAFALETGAGLLVHHFSKIEIRRFEDGLVVSEAEPLAAYICSGVIGDQIGPRRPELVSFLDMMIARNGAIHITKDSGLFVAR